MATFVITFPDTVRSRIIDGLVGGDEGYQQVIEGDPSPPTKAQYAKQVLLDMVKTRVKNYEANRDAASAQLKAMQSVDQEITLS